MGGGGAVTASLVIMDLGSDVLATQGTFLLFCLQKQHETSFAF